MIPCRRLSLSGLSHPTISGVDPIAWLSFHALTELSRHLTSQSEGEQSHTIGPGSGYTTVWQRERRGAITSHVSHTLFSRTASVAN